MAAEVGAQGVAAITPANAADLYGLEVLQLKSPITRETKLVSSWSVKSVFLLALETTRPVSSCSSAPKSPAV